jgi:hypothetical protein
LRGNRWARAGHAIPVWINAEWQRRAPDVTPSIQGKSHSAAHDKDTHRRLTMVANPFTIAP